MLHSFASVGRVGVVGIVGSWSRRQQDVSVDHRDAIASEQRDNKERPTTSDLVGPTMHARGESAEEAQESHRLIPAKRDFRSKKAVGLELLSLHF